VIVAIGIAALVGAAITWTTSRPPRDLGVGLEAAPSAPAFEPPASNPTMPPTPTADPTTAPPPEVPSVGTRSARLADQDVEPVVAPARLAVPALGVDAPVVPVGVEPDGQMTVPTDVVEVGWYRHGPTPGARGSAVLAGHVDSRTQGRGVFFALRDVAVGDEVTVTDAAGATTTWQVVGRRTLDKDTLPVDELFRRDGAPRLVLVTCGGDYDADRRSYRSNVVVIAEPRP
jgi:hypothetical protein